MKKNKDERKGETEMNELITSTSTMTSIQISEIIGKRHADIMRDIRDEAEKLEAGAIATERKFALSEYKDSTGRTLPCYNLTREGVLQLAARYDAVTRAKLIEMAMRSERPKAMSQLEIMHQMTGALIEQDRQLKELSGAVDTIQSNLQDMRDVLELAPEGWRKDCSSIVSKISKKLGGYDHIEIVWGEVYKLLDERLGVNVNQRVTNMKKTMALNGAGKSALDKVNRLDAIANDKKLVDGLLHIVKQLAVKHGVA